MLLWVGPQVTNKAGEEQHEPKVVGRGLWPDLKAAASDWCPQEHQGGRCHRRLLYFFAWTAHRGGFLLLPLSRPGGGAARGDGGHSGLLGDKGGQSVKTMFQRATTFLRIAAGLEDQGAAQALR
jgi:hypothetical protein